MTTIRRRDRQRASDARAAALFIAPAAMTMAAVALIPIVWTAWESLYLHDLRMPWLGRPFVGAGNYVEAAFDRRFWSALAHTGVFVAITVPLELAAGLVVALVLERLTVSRGVIRTAVLLPWAVPTVVAALIWRFAFETPSGLVTTSLAALGIAAPAWFADPIAAWLPLVLADAWKSIPFVAILLFAGLQTIDRSTYEAAAIDGAGRWRQLTEITIPLLKPTLLVAGLFRSLDAFRVFDIVFIMTAGGPGTATEPIALYTFSTLLQNLRFGYGAALSMIVFLLAFGFALVAVRRFGGAAGTEVGR